MGRPGVHMSRGVEQPARGVKLKKVELTAWIFCLRETTRFFGVVEKGSAHRAEIA